MNRLIEISVNGDIYFFQNDLTESEYTKLYNFTISYLEDQKNQNISFSALNYIHAVGSEIRLTLKQYIVDKVISI